MATKNVGLKDFLEAQGLEKYAGKFEENGARNMEDLEDFDNQILTEDIGMSNLEAKRFLRKVNELFGRKVRCLLLLLLLFTRELQLPSRTLRRISFETARVTIVQVFVKFWLMPFLKMPIYGEVQFSQKIR